MRSKLNTLRACEEKFFNFFSLLSLSKCLMLLVITCSLQSNLLAQDKIYKWTDASGKVHFSNSPHDAQQQEANLPEISKENLNKKIENIKQNTPANCESHGGIDCSQGKDLLDGSLICLDGFKDSIQPFDFYCLESKLSAFTKVEEKNDIATIEVSIRNESPIKAVGIEVKYKLEEFRHIEVELLGASEIEPYGLETYRYISKDKLDKRYPDRAIIGKTIIRCNNCSSIKRHKN